MIVSPNQSLEIATANFNQGNKLKEQGMLAESIASYQKAIQIKPDYTQALLNLGEIYEDQEDYTEAVKYYQRVIDLEPENHFRYLRLARALKQQDKINEAIAAYQKAIEIKPDYSATHAQLGAAMMAQKNIQGAIASYQKAIALQPKQPAWVYVALGGALNKNGQVDEAIATYQKGIDLYPKRPEFCVKQSKIYFQQAQIDREDAEQKLINKAIEKAQAALEIEPDFLPALEHLALIYESRKQFFSKKLVEIHSKQRQLKAKDKWILLHKKSTINDFSQELKKIKSEELDSIIEGENYSLFDFSEIHNISKSSQKFSSSAIEIFEKNMRRSSKKQDEEERFKEFADNKQLSFISPYTGKIVYTRKSLLIDLDYIAYVFNCNNGIFYLIRHNRYLEEFVYIPEIEAVIVNSRKFKNDRGEVASIVNNLKKYIIKNKEEFCTYIESESETKSYVSIYQNRPFHYLFDRLGGLTYLDSCGLLDKIDGFINKRSTNYFELTRLFPKISAKELINIEGSDKEKELVYLQKLISRNNGFVYFIRKLDLKNINPEYFLSAAESSTQDIETLASFIVRKPKFSVNTGENIVDLLESHHLLVWIGIAIEKRHWIEQVDGIKGIINELRKEFPNIGVVIDGMTGADNQSLARSTSKKLYEKENQLFSKILINIPEEIGVYSTIGMNSRHKLFIAKSIDFFITQLGTQSILPSFMAKKPGILHALPGFGDKRLYDPNTAILIDEKHIVPKESTETLAQGSRIDFQSYSLDWHVIYKEIKEKILPNWGKAKIAVI